MQVSEKNLRDILALRVPGEGQLNYSIQAGAGGGKTTMLSARICRQILEGTRIDEFAIITYTNAAANELREKISNVLRKAKSDPGIDEVQKERAAEALNKVELMQISTIHAFLLKILREYAFESGITLDARMLEADEDDARKEIYFNKWYKEHFRAVEALEWVHYSESSGKSYNIGYSVTKNLFMDIADVREEIVYDRADHSDIFLENARKYVKKWMPSLISLSRAIGYYTPQKADGTPYDIKKSAQQIIDIVNEIEISYLNDSYGIQEAVSLSTAVMNMKDIVETKDNIYSRYKQTVPEVDIALDDAYSHIVECEKCNCFEKYYSVAEHDCRIGKTIEMICELQKEYRAEVDSQTYELSNNDILYRADLLMRNNHEILDKLRNKYSKIYVDEFQDTTGLQAGIVEMLCEKSGTEPGSGDFQKDKLLVVGDPKQSIYRFTGAEKSVYDEVHRKMDGLNDDLARAEILQSNFRSNADIVGWVNGCFSKLMGSEYSAMDTDWNVAEKNALHGVYTYTLTKDAKGKTEKYNVESDINAVVELVKSLVGNRSCFVEDCERNKEGEITGYKLRTIRYSDIMIISKYATKMSAYAKRFSEEGIPLNIQGKISVADETVLKNFALLIEYLGKSRNKLNRIAAEQIIAGTDITGAEGVGDRLDRLKEELDGMKLDAASTVQYLLTREELYFPKDTTYSAPELRTYRIHLHQMVETCLLNNTGNLNELAHLMKQYIETEIKREIPLESGENAVRMMNVHQSKGLTGQIVIIADRSNAEECKYSSFRKAGKFYPTLRYKLADIKNASTFYIPSFGWNIDIVEQVYRDEMSEAVRLQYVAATRAAHALIIMPISYGKTSWFSNKYYELESLKGICEWIRERKEDSTDYSPASECEAAAHPVFRLSDLEKSIADADFEEMAKGQLIGVSPSGLEQKGSTGYTAEEIGYVPENRPAASGFGTVMHKVYELIWRSIEVLEALEPDELNNAIVRIINRAILEDRETLLSNDVPEEFVAYLAPKMKEYFRKVIIPIWNEADKVYPEYSFSFYVDVEEREDFKARFGEYLKNSAHPVEIDEETIWVNGIADLVVRLKDGRIKVYDYKSDGMNGKPMADFEAAVANKYKGQLELYSYAMSKIFKVDSVETEIIHLYR